jgi:hypothetical protein
MLADSDLRLTGGTNSVFASICNTNDLFLVKQLYMGTYVFEICKILEITSWFVNEIMILEMIYQNRTKRHVWPVILDALIVS